MGRPRSVAASLGDAGPDILHKTMARFRHVILFTWHAYGTWLPDRPQGYYRNKQGLLPPDGRRAQQYRSSMLHAAARFGAPVQRALIEQLIEGARLLEARLYCVATDSAHVHFLIAWNGARTVERMHRSLKRAATQALSTRFGTRPWFTRGGHDRRVRSYEHFIELRDQYLPSHRGWKWDTRRGYFH